MKREVESHRADVRGRKKVTTPGWLPVAMLATAALCAISLMCLVAYGLSHTPV